MLTIGNYYCYYYGTLAHTNDLDEHLHERSIPICHGDQAVRILQLTASIQVLRLRLERDSTLHVLLRMPTEIPDPGRGPTRCVGAHVDQIVQVSAYSIVSSASDFE